MPNLYIGVDIGKTTHHAALVSAPLLERKPLESCPVMKIDNARSDFERLYASMSQHAPPSECFVLLEKTGHYGAAIEQFLQEHGIHVFRIHAHRYGKNKSDKIDARSLAGIIYNQIELHMAMVDRRQQIYPILPPTPTSQQLRGMVRHRYELTQEITRRKHKLTAILDELFPEFTQVYIDPNSPSALACRSKFPTPQAIALAPLDDLVATKLHNLPSRASLGRLQELACSTIGTKSLARQEALVLEQSMLIIEMRLLGEHLADIEDRIAHIIEASREGQILTSMVGIGPTVAAILLSHISNIANFEQASRLRGYLGWAPRKSQTGTTYDNAVLNRAGSGLLKQTIYLAVMAAIKYDPSWKLLYQRLVERMCPYDARRQKYMGKMKVIGHICGRFIGVMYTLLKRDATVVAACADNTIIPPPELYDMQRHLQHIQQSPFKRLLQHS